MEIVERPLTRNEDGDFDASFVQSILSTLDTDDREGVRELVKDLHAADLADLIELLRPDQRAQLVTLLGRKFDPEVLTELDAPVRDALFELLTPRAVSVALGRLDTDDAVYLLEDMDEEEQEQFLRSVPRKERAALKRALDYPEDSAGRLMQTAFVAAPGFWTVGQVIEYMRGDEDVPEQFYEVFVVDPLMHLIGTVDVSRILRSGNEIPLEQIMATEQTTFTVTDEREDVAYKFERYNLVSAPVVDTDGRVVGMLTVDDIVDVIQEEAEEDILRLGGVGDEVITDPVWRTTRSRFTWLLINLFTAILASTVIGAFDATISEMVALAVLMPIVASMGGNAGTQTMTIAVRALATRSLGKLNAVRVVGRECAVGLINGVLFALILGAVVYAWFGSDSLGLVLGAAMVINMLAAALAGILIPLTLDYFDVDPAVSSTVFVTTVTDVVGFFAFLGLASLWLM
ncbi:magnesium transporter [Rhodoligotrophos appendicifer]|uniref:magnesium transporter n=1 Tax=Rhodoligotrophos appendicifer TaxID=987056 RepID=UPI0011869287|nr:magnesium transporter [Rhodoligotrophos appendicifer]